MPEVTYPLDFFTPECQCRVWQKQDYTGMADPRVGELLGHLPRHAISMLTTDNPFLSKVEAVKLVSVFTQLKVMVENGFVSDADLPMVNQTSILIACSLAVSLSPERQWEGYAEHRRNKDFQWLLELAKAD